MKLISRTFERTVAFCTGIIRCDWVHSGVEHFRLCSETMGEFVDIPGNVNKIEIVLTTRRVGPHSLAITKKTTTYDIGHTYRTIVNLIKVDGYQVTLTSNIECMLSGYLGLHKKVFATIYYEEK